MNGMGGGLRGGACTIIQQRLQEFSENPWEKHHAAYHINLNIYNNGVSLLLFHIKTDFFADDIFRVLVL